MRSPEFEDDLPSERRPMRRDDFEKVSCESRRNDSCSTETWLPSQNLPENLGIPSGSLSRESAPLNENLNPLSVYPAFRCTDSRNRSASQARSTPRRLSRSRRRIASTSS